MTYVNAYCDNCNGCFVVEDFEIVGCVEDLTNNLSYLETQCNDCQEHVDRKTLWIDANGYYIMNMVFHEDIEGR